MLWAKKDIAVTVIVGPVLDSAGAEYASAVIGDMSISKNGGTLTAMASAATLTYIANGMYTLVTRTTDLDTLGRAQITCNKSTYQMPKQEFMVMPANVFDSMILGTDVLASALSTTSLDAILSRNVSNVETTMPEHCLGTIILAMLEHSISGATLTIKGTDGSTSRFTKTLTTNASADPITGIQ
jgi:hypothetical protein